MDVDQEKAEGEALDLLDGYESGAMKTLPYGQAVYEECKDADIVVVTAGASTKNLVNPRLI